MGDQFLVAEACAYHGRKIVDDDSDAFLNQHEGSLWKTIDRLHRLVERHIISIRGLMFFAVLKDTNDRLVKLIDLTKGG